MSDDTTHSSRALHAKTAAFTSVAVMTLTLAALAFTLSFDALRQLAIETGVRPHLAWMAPVALDVAQAAATLGLVALGTVAKYAAARRYCMALATVTVLLSVAGNGYHAYRLAGQQAARITAGEDLGYAPQPAAVAAGIAMIFPLLWLGLLHLFTIMLRAIGDERGEARTIAAAAAISDNTAAEHTTSVDEARIILVASSASAAEQDTSPTPMPEPVATEHSAPKLNERGTSLKHRNAPSKPATRRGWPQTVEGLQAFLRDSALTDAVQRVAVVRLKHPDYNQVQVAGELHLDKSTVSRHWRTFVDAARTEGFTVPPLPQPFQSIAEPQAIPELQPA